MGPVAGRIVSANHWLRISGILGAKMVLLTNWVLELYMADALDPEEVFYRDLFPYFYQIRGDQPNPTQRITKAQPICIRLRRRRKKKLLQPKPYSSPKRPRKKEIKNTGTPEGLEIFHPFACDFQGQEMRENRRRTVRFFYFTKTDKLNN